MNERIKELADQAGYTPLPGFDFANDLQEVFLKKFAELIVRECISVVSRRDVGDHNREDAEVARCVADIKKHFGVEET